MLFQSGSRTTSNDTERGWGLGPRDLRCELLEILAEEGREFLRLGIVCGWILPRGARIEQVVRDTGDVRRDLQSEDRLTSSRRTVELSRQRRANHQPRALQVHPMAHAVRPAGPAGVHEATLYVVLRDPLAEHLRVHGGRQRQERRAEARGECFFGLGDAA